MGRDRPSTNAANLDGYPFATYLAADPMGNVTLAVGFEGKLNGPGVALDARGGQYALLVAKYDENCRVLWSRAYGGALSAVLGASVAAAGSDTVLAGGFGGALDLGNGPLLSPLVMAAFIGKLDASGNALWARSFIASGGARMIDVDVSVDGLIATLGYFAGEVDLGGGPIADDGGAHIVSLFSAAGAHLWSHRLPSTMTGERLRFLGAGQQLVVDYGGQAGAHLEWFDLTGNSLRIESVAWPAAQAFEPSASTHAATSWSAGVRSSASTRASCCATNR